MFAHAMAGTVLKNALIDQTERSLLAFSSGKCMLAWKAPFGLQNRKDRYCGKSSGVIRLRAKS
jgi:hypothetical protein